MTRTSLRDVSCSIARTVDILSDAWAWLIVRDAFLGVRHFDELRADLGISSKVLAQRLVDLTDAAIGTDAKKGDVDNGNVFSSEGVTP
ncbi:helix-turn-helix domain-containing protein, partial [Brevibacterium picturae]|uniref:winged helix-turn-helix transcriptional regulator n=1 Tax=Brevibacterium picturae TaxID=260553 RepID=UPI0031F7EDBF